MSTHVLALCIIHESECHLFALLYLILASTGSWMGLSNLRFAQLPREALRAVESFNVLIEILRFLAQQNHSEGKIRQSL